MVMSVTEILSVFTDFSRVSATRLEYAANRGTEVHNLLAAHAQGIWIPDMTEDCRGYYASFLKWWPMVQEIVFVEKELVSTEHGFKGHPDLCAIVKGDYGNASIIDYKTPLLPSKTWAGQCAAYLHLARENGYNVDRCGTLRLDPFGKTPKMDWYNEDGRDWFAFLSALYAVRYFKEKGD
jgi:hypothetical protein